MTADELRALLTLKISTDKRIAALLKKIAAGKGSFGDTMNYALISGELTGEQLAEVVLELTDDREELVRLLVHDRWEDINEQCAAVQTAFDEHNALHLATQKAAFPAERVMQIAHSLSDPTVSDDTIKRRARSVSNVVVSMHDDFIEANAKFRSGAGLQCFVTRVTDGSCCPWCTRLAGRYRYPEDIPDEIFRRHDNCGCTVTYENGRKRQDVWSKRTWEVPDEEAGSQKPTVLSREQGQKLQADNAPKRLTGGGESGIINIEIDELTPCLKDNKTGELVQTEVRKVTDRSELLGCTEKKGWNFPWSKAPRDAEIYALRVKGSTTIEGLIALKKEPENAAVYLYWGNAAPHNRITEANTQKKYNGVGGHLFAIAADISVKEGYGGFMYADAANKDLYELFVNEYGATPIPTHNNPYRFFFDGEATRKILNTYTFDRR